MGDEIFQVIVTQLVLVAFFVAFIFLIKGMIKTFMRQPLIATLCMIVLLPIWVIWSFVELFTDEMKSKIEKQKPTKMLYVGVWFLSGAISDLLNVFIGAMFIPVISMDTSSDFYIFMTGYYIVDTLTIVGAFLYVYNIFNTLNIKRVYPYLVGLCGLKTLLLSAGLSNGFIISHFLPIIIVYVLPVASFLVIIYAIRAYYIRKPDRWY